MWCRHCKEEVRGDYVEEWRLAYPACNLGSSCMSCHTKLEKIRNTVIVVLLVVFFIAMAL